jgi:hypothetical protein
VNEVGSEVGYATWERDNFFLLSFFSKRFRHRQRWTKGRASIGQGPPPNFQEKKFYMEK